MAPPLTGRLWAVVLADEPVSPFLLSVAESSLSATLERTGLAIPPSDTVVVGTRASQLQVCAQTTTFPGNVLIQPRHRGSAPLQLWPIYWIHRFDPEAIVVSIPVRPAVHQDGLLDHASRVAEWVAGHPRWIVMVGTRPTGPEPERDWIVRAECLDGNSERVWRVHELQRFSSPDAARKSLARNALWNTRVVVGRARAFIDATRLCLPLLHAAFSEAAQWAGTWREAEALEGAYDHIAESRFFAALKLASFPCLASSCMPSVAWEGLRMPAPLGQADARLRESA